jgi:hypothetical protein
VLSEIEDYRKMGIRAFIFSGYPHLEECRHFGRLVMPELKTCSLPVEYGRVPAQVPATPLGSRRAPLMNRVKVGELELSRIVYGMWRLGDDADTSPAHVQAKVEACLAQGITTMDQADIYGDYGAEALLGAAFKARRACATRSSWSRNAISWHRSEAYAGARVKYYDTSEATSRPASKTR